MKSKSKHLRVGDTSLGRTECATRSKSASDSLSSESKSKAVSNPNSLLDLSNPSGDALLREMDEDLFGLHIRGCEIAPEDNKFHELCNKTKQRFRKKIIKAISLAKQEVFDDCQEYIDKVAGKVAWLVISHGVKLDSIKPSWEEIIKKHNLKKTKR